MTWLTWRQHRWEAAAAACLLLALGTAVLVMTLAGSSLLTDIGQECAAGVGVSPASCGTWTAQYAGSYPWIWVVIVGTLLPALAGVFVGAPLVAREVENSTHLLVWSQGVTRRRRFVIRVGWVAAGAAVAAALLAAIGQGWFAMQRGMGSSGFGTPSLWDGFEIGPSVVIAYTLFAIALGVVMGAAIRRTVPAMAATLAGFVAVRACVAGFARPAYVTPLTARANIDTGLFQTITTSSEWQSGSASFVNAAGHPVVLGQSYCVTISPTMPEPGCLHGPIYMLESYQPASRFWLFQGIETLLFLGLAALLFALAYRLVMRIR